MTENTHTDTPSIPQLDLESVDTAVALFGTLCNTHPQLASLMNHFGPMMCAALLYTYSQDFEVDPADDTNLIPTKSPLEAEAQAIGWIRAVTAAHAIESEDLSVSPSDGEIDSDTEITPVL